jgi:hypothetical protein
LNHFGSLFLSLDALTLVLSTRVPEQEFVVI